MIKNYFNHYILLIIFVSITTVISCKKDANSGKIVTMNIASKLLIGGASPPASAHNPDTVYYYNITEDNTNQKYVLAKGSIQGFNYVEGNQYKIKVKITPIPKPMEDGPIDSYSLIEILSTTKVDN